MSCALSVRQVNAASPCPVALMQRQKLISPKLPCKACALNVACTPLRRWQLAFVFASNYIIIYLYLITVVRTHKGLIDKILFVQLLYHNPRELLSNNYTLNPKPFASTLSRPMWVTPECGTL